MQHTAHHHVPLHTEHFAHPHKNVSALGIEPGMKVADFGSGSGAYVLAIAEVLGNTGHIYAVDVQRDLLKRVHNEAIRRGFKNVSVLWGDLEVPGGSKIADKHLDIVVISNLLFQVDEKETVLQEARRILKPGGRLALIDWNDSYGGMGPHKDSVVTKTEGLALAGKVGFAQMREFAAGAHHWGLLLRSMPQSL